MAPYLDKMLYLNFHYRSHETHGFVQKKFDEYAGEQVSRVSRGGLFGGPARLMQQVTNIYDLILSKTLSDGYMGTEENIFTLLTYLYPDLCNVKMTDATLYPFLREVAGIAFAPKSVPQRERVIYKGIIDNKCSLGIMCGGHVIGVTK